MKPLSNDKVQYLVNPRPDLIEDVDLWARLLLKAYPIDGSKSDGLFAALHGMRCAGARLRLGQTTAILSSPEDFGQDEWACWKQEHLEPHRETLLRLLKELMPIEEVA